MLWERWEGEMPQDPQGRGISWDPWLCGSSRRGWGWAQPWVSVRRAEGLVCVWYLLPSVPWAWGCAEPQEPPRANPVGRCPK